MIQWFSDYFCLLSSDSTSTHKSFGRGSQFPLLSGLILKTKRYKTCIAKAIISATMPICIVDFLLKNFFLKCSLKFSLEIIFIENWNLKFDAVGKLRLQLNSRPLKSQFWGNCKLTVREPASASHASGFTFFCKVFAKNS